MSLAQAVKIDIGPKINGIAPRFDVTNNQGRQVSIRDLSGEKGLIVLFFRSADWCPFCKQHLIEFNAQAENLKNLGYGLAAVSYDNSEVLKTFSEKHNMSYPLLSDIDAKTMINYDILNTQYNKGTEHYGIPHPGVIIINKQGNITHKHFFEGYKKRVKFAELYQDLKTLSL
ncbi:AhpC/TSA family protein [Pseudoalteromonas sp. NBT06-2]|nr:AhpC/TSA family protein [Pseudoalteromonas sp. NBT06-2]